MKKVIIIIVIGIVLFGGCVAIGYFSNRKDKPQNKGENVQNQPLVNEEGSSLNNEAKDDKVEETKKQTVLPNSRIGIDVLHAFEISNLYSTKFYSLLDKENLSQKVKRTWAFINITQTMEYLHMLEYSNDGGATYISAQNLQTVVKEIFEDSDVSDGDLFLDFKYDEKNKRYVIPAMGMSNENELIAIEVPYEILENGTNYEVYMYRVFLKQEMKEDIEKETVENKAYIYYDSTGLMKACEITDDRIFDNLDNQIDVIKENIDSKKIDKYNLMKTKYTLSKVGSSYKINKYEKI